MDFVLTIWSIASNKLVHRPFTFFTGETSFVINISHGNHFFSLKNFTITSWTRGISIFGTLNSKGFNNRLIQKSWFRASPKKFIKKEIIRFIQLSCKTKIIFFHTCSCYNKLQFISI